MNKILASELKHKGSQEWICYFVFINNNLFIYVDHIKNLSEDLKLLFKDFWNMDVPEYNIFHLMLKWKVEIQTPFLRKTF